LIGLIVFSWSLLQAIGGLFLTILQRYLRSLRLTYAQIRIYHATSGVLLFTLSCFVSVLGLASNWFKNKMPNNTIVYSIIFYLLTSSMLFLAHKCVEQVKNRYVKRKITSK
jgi:cytochrome b-561 domain-containing protein 2